MSEPGVGSTVAGYRIEEVLGRGGMGVVYRADDDRLGRSAAVKVIAPEQAGDAAFRRRFIEESRAPAAIDHPNVLPVYEAGEEDGVLFLVTRMVEGADLAALLEREGPLDVDRALALAAQIGAALDAAHARGLIHRDVKPGNVLVTRDPGPGTEHCYLTDFGLAQRDDRRSRLTTTGQFVGTLDYIAPEQIQGGKVDGRADVYALAALFYECATGAPPFVRDSHPALLFAHLSDPPPPISGELDGAPEALDRVVARAMAKAPEDRFVSCSEFVAAARAALGGAAAAGPTVAGASTRRPPAAETVAAGGAGGGAVDRRPAEESASAPPPRGTSSDEAGRRRRWALLGGALAVLAVAGALALLLLGSGGGGDGTTAALRLSTETISLAREVGEGTGRLTESVEAAGPTSDLVGVFERAEADAADLAGRAQSELAPGDPGQADLRQGARNLEEASARLAAIAAEPTASRASGQAREARRAMNGALNGLSGALEALRAAFAAEAATEAAEAVEDSVAQLRDGRAQLIAPFEALIRAL
jgi:hypothetical protein